jgi:enamine deaminase RidA (YjgF/YER057c/UK114 family)
VDILQPPNWQRPKGYSNGIVASGRTVFIAGQVGWNEACGFETDDLAGQVRQALQNILTVLAQASGQSQDIVRMTWFITDKQEYLTNQAAIGEAYRAVMGKHFPVMSMLVVHALIEDRAKVEIEATAVIPN